MMNLFGVCHIDLVNLVGTEALSEVLLCELVTGILFVLVEFITRMVRTISSVHESTGFPSESTGLRVF